MNRSAPISWLIGGYPRIDKLSQDVNRASIRIGKRGARVLGFASASRGPSQDFESPPCLTRRHAPNRSSIAANVYKFGT